ncbi:MAG: ABC transporter permease subunit [Pseudobdellovibrionaceae bacterium]
MSTRWGLFAFFLIFLFFPYGILLSKFSLALQLDVPELWWAFKNSTLQALMSSVGSFFAGLFLLLGFFQVQRASFYRLWMTRPLEVLLLLPNFLPPLFILLVLLSLVQPFPTGIPGVVLVHIMMNAGLVALLLKSLIENKLRPLVEAAYMEGSGQWRFFQASFGMLRRDLFAIFLFVFILCFCSFSVPLIAGGGKATTLEILIYEKIRISGAWGEALSLSFIQMLLILLLSSVPFQARKNLFSSQNPLPMLKSRVGMVLLFLYCFGLIFYFLSQSLKGWLQVFAVQGLWQAALELLPFSLMFGLSVGGLVAFLLLLTAWGAPDEKLHRLISGMVSPSTALMGFSLLFFISNESPWVEIKWALGFAYLIFSTLYRWGWDQKLSGLRDQIQVANLLGASRHLIFTDILLPQLLNPLAWIASVASLWALGDFALGKIVMGRDASLSLLIETLMSSYRLPAAHALMGLLLVMGCLCFLFFWGIAYVSRRALAEKI